MEQIKPKKSLSQNFLRDKNIARKIVEAADIKDDDTVIEIGPGTGALTEILLTKNIKLIAIEIDNRAIDYLSEKFPVSVYPNFTLIHSDIREYRIPPLQKGGRGDLSSSPPLQKGGRGDLKYKIIGNLPYNISSDILFWIFENSDVIDSAVIMLQKEVARRLSAKPRTKDYGILSVAAGLAGNSKTAFDVSPGCFYPKPEVTSSIVVINLNYTESIFTEYKDIMKLVKAAFGQRRKVLSNSLRCYLSDISTLDYHSVLLKCKEDIFDLSSKRAEELSKEDFINLYLFFKNL
ncbi:MAG: rRNA (adenine1518-N6/adenine1519-N6)-dimethyltransferase [Bacteroidota bacterium]|nr:rRNA (adenine1518-N6/adenine1519-N6)-dimethyltransferase [Bacteroidota bacterium]